MIQRTVNLAEHVNKNVGYGDADFPVSLQTVFAEVNGVRQDMPDRRAVVRMDTLKPLSVVSDRYTLVSHKTVLEKVQGTIATLAVGEVPRGVFVSKGGAQMSALFKFPALAQPVVAGDDICPCIKFVNSYDATQKIQLMMGAFRFVCTNLAVGGGGVFACGFVSLHTGEINVDEIGERLAKYLLGFETILETYRHWREIPMVSADRKELLAPLAKRHRECILSAVKGQTVYDLYNAATDHATHKVRSARLAFELLDKINATFQSEYPVLPATDKRLALPAAPEPVVAAIQ